MSLVQRDEISCTPRSVRAWAVAERTALRVSRTW